MFTRKTVFILGAGASWHYGYPTGEELVRMVIQRAEMAKTFFSHSLAKTNVQLPNYIKKKLPEKPTATDQRQAWQEGYQ
jgi:hypothetical protein